MAILDHRGLPVDTSKLKEEIAGAAVGTVRTTSFNSAVVGLTPAKLGAILRAADEGSAEAMLTLAEEMEEKDPHYSSVLRTRKLAVSRLKTTVIAASDDKRDVELADEVTKLVKRPAFRTLIKNQLDALGRSFAVSEIDWDTSNPRRWIPKTYIRRDQRSFCYDRKTGTELRMRDETAPNDGLTLEPFKFVVHTPQLKTGLAIRGGLARLVAVSFMCKSYTLKDWIVFAEVFGMPLRLGTHEDNATDEQKADLLAAVTNIGTDAAAIIPKSMQIDFPAAANGAGGDKLFMGLADWLDRQTSKAVLGQTSTADAQPGGLGTGTADQANEVREDIRDDDAMNLAATIQRDVIEPYITLNYGVPPNGFPQLHIGEEHKEDLKLFTEAIGPMIDRGLRVESSVVLDKFGLQEAEEGAETLKPAAYGLTTPGPIADAKTSDKNVALPSDPTSAFNGTQIDAMLKILKDVGAGLLPRESGIAALVEAFPISPDSAEKMMGDIGRGFKIAPPAAPPKAPPVQLSHVRAATARELMQRVLQGETLTEDQRELVHTLAAQRDEIDVLAEEALSDWQRVVDPLTNPIMAMVESATSFDHMLELLSEAKLDTKELQRTLARLTFTARGRGYATDKP